MKLQKISDLSLIPARDKKRRLYLLLTIFYPDGITENTLARHAGLKSISSLLARMDTDGFFITEDSEGKLYADGRQKTFWTEYLQNDLES